ncbi:MAG: phosphatidylglycerophosphatase A [Oligoflexia bacterium]|nr:phosphatidylglycerophosphatase A [Oligoflexia bacterium]
MQIQQKHKSSNTFIFLNKVIATFFGVGFAPWAPGTFGSMCAIPIFLLCFMLISSPNVYWILTAIIIFLFIIGIISSHIYEKFSNKHDPREVVIDEVIGQLITLTGIQFITSSANILNLNLNLNTTHLIIISFILFRFFDIVKPWPISVVNDHLQGGIGIVLDDVLAAFFSIALFVAINIFIANTKIIN